MKKNNYSESVKKLRKFLREREDERQTWAKEKWAHTDGKMFKISRFLVPLISLVGLFSMVVLCMIKFMNIPAIQQAIFAKVFNTSTKESPIVYPFFIIVFLSLCLLVYTSIGFIRKKYKKSPFLLFGSSLILTICSLLRYTADQGTFADNSDYEFGPTFTYFEICLFTMVVFAVLLVISIILMIIIIKDKKEFNRNVDHILTNKIIPQNKQSDLLTEAEYAKLIDEYIEKETEKISQRKNK